MIRSRETSIVKPATLERGEARYFHGRVEILDDFKGLLERAKTGNSGTSVVIQAAPGAGKTALLTECARIAGGRGYVVAEVEPSWFLDPKTLYELIRSSWENWFAWLQHGAVNIDLGAIKAELIVGRGARTCMDVIKKGKGPLLLLLDEAQRLARIVHEKGEQFMQMVDMLKVIHAGGAGRPVILVAAGLGATTQALKDLDISRFNPGCKINPGMLKKEFTRAIIQDWLQKEGRVKGDPARWIDDIAEQTYGWPQHIMAYVWPALKQLKLTGGEMTGTGLKTVLKEGQKGRIKFYESRAEGLFRTERQCIARAVVGIESGENVDKGGIIASLRKEFSKGETERIFTLALHRGMLDVRGDSYAIPIPSMHDWLVSNYAPNQKRTDCPSPSPSPSH